MFVQGITEDVLQAPVLLVRMVILSPAGCKPQVVPVCCPVAGPRKSPLGVDEGLEPYNRMVVQRFPVRGDAPRYEPEQVRGQVRHGYPGQDKKAGVDGDLVEIGDPFLLCPSEVSVPYADVAGSG